MQRFAHRLAELERQQAQRRRVSTAPVYTIIRRGDPRPDVDGPVYRLVSPRLGETAHA